MLNIPLSPLFLFPFLSFFSFINAQKPQLETLSQTLSHSRTKRTNAKNTIESITRDLEKRKTNEESLKKALADTERAKDAAVEEQRRKAERQGMRLGKEDLAKYHEL